MTRVGRLVLAVGLFLRDESLHHVCERDHSNWAIVFVVHPKAVHAQSEQLQQHKIERCIRLHCANWENTLEETEMESR